MQERRHHIRLATPVLLQFPNPATMKTERSYTQDVSFSGLQFPTMIRFEIGQEIPMTLQLPFHDVVLQTTGVVMWIREISRLGASQYSVGVQFRWMQDSDQRRLTRHLTALFKQ